MKVCLINSPLEDFYSTGIRRQPLGLLSIAASIRAAGHEVTLINGHSPTAKVMPRPQEFSYLKDFSDFPFKNYYHFGLSYEEIERQLKKIKPDLFLVSAMFTTYYEETVKCIELIRKQHPGVPIAVGGYHATLYPDEMLKYADYVIAGEGERAVLELINGKNKNKIIKSAIIENLDELPFPARDLLKPRDFKIYKKQGTPLVTSRGCPNNCSFCSSKDMWGNRYRVRSIDSIMKEIDEVYHSHRVTLLDFEDDNLFINKKRATEFLTALIDYQNKNKVQFDCTAMNGLSIEQLDSEIVLLMKQAGFSEMNISLVSYSADIQQKLGRPFDTEKVKEMIGLAQRQGMNVRAYYILGLPEQTKSEIELTQNFLRDCQVKQFPSVFYNVYAPQNEWKMQRSSAFFNETERLKRPDLLHYFHRSIIFNDEL